MLQRSTLVASLLCLLACGGAYGLDDVSSTGGCSYTLSVKRDGECSGNNEALTELQNTVSELREEVATLRQQAGRSGGAVYTRWGRTVCPDTSTLLYAGSAAGSHYSHTGGSSELICLPEQPEWGRFLDGFQGESYVYGTEYETGHKYGENDVFSKTNSGGQSLNNHDVPCAVCYTSGRSAVKTFPAMLQCPDGWSAEYNGYLMAGHHTHKERIQAVCLDEAPEVTAASRPGNDNGALVYNMEVQCGSLHCPPYAAGRELICTVCSR